MSLSNLDRVTSLYLGFVILCGIVYTCLDLTPSAFGVVLKQIGAEDEGLVFGSPQAIRSDEWSGSTSFIQIAVRNGFQRKNITSFYKEDLRSFYVLPLKDWSLVFKPEMWAFFVTSPAFAFSLYWSLQMCAFLTGFFLLFRLMGLEPFVSASAATLVYFCGFTQFWWTSFGSLIAGLAWILVILLAPLRWWLKTLILAWIMPVIVFSFVYPTYIAEFAFAAIVIIAAVRPSLFRSPKEWVAPAIGGLITGVAVYFYYHDLLLVMRNTWYPGKRIGQPGTTPLPVALSQLYPFLAFSLRDYRFLSGANICEGATVGSFLPLLTLCLLSPKFLKINRSLRNSLIVLLAAIALISLWQLTPAPQWIGHLLVWDHGNAERLLVVSGLLITVASLLVWREKLLSPDPFRIILFVVVGPIFSYVLKALSLRRPFSVSHLDLALCAFAVGAGVIACLSPVASRLPLLLTAIVMMNVFAFGRFNPLQSAEPIFNVPETDVIHHLREKEASTPGKFLLIPNYFGATLNAMGFRSVSHTLLAPSLPLFRKYFPAMDPIRFDFIFNRYAHILVTDDPFPRAVELFIINVPAEAFEPPRDIRTVAIDIGAHKDCSVQRGGAIERVSAQGNQLTLEGWAPWKGETADQELRVTTARPLRPGPLHTVTRPDISELKTDYAYTRSGFRLQLSSADGRPIQPDEIVLVARGTSQGIAQLSGCGCPSD